MVDYEGRKRWRRREATGGDDDHVDSTRVYPGLGEKRIDGREHPFSGLIDGVFEVGFTAFLEEELRCISLVAETGLEVDAAHEGFTLGREAVAPAKKVLRDLEGTSAVAFRLEAGIVEKQNRTWVRRVKVEKREKYTPGAGERDRGGGGGEETEEVGEGGAR